jgi:hypothetical protein
MERLDVDERGDSVLFEPGEERARRVVIGHAGVLVADRCGEKIRGSGGRRARPAAIGAGVGHAASRRDSPRTSFNMALMSTAEPSFGETFAAISC